LLGLGPGRPETLPFTCGERVFWLEEPRILRHLNALRPSGYFPESWRKVSAREALELAPQCRVYYYRYNSRLAPLFWGPFMGRLNSALVTRAAAGSSGRDSARKGRKGVVFLPGTGRQLLHIELAQAFDRAGFDVVELSLWSKDRQNSLAEWKLALAGRKPALALSVNFRGLDPEGEIFWLCRALGTAVAVWCVDNPWNLLSGIPLPWWKEAPLFVTDASFIAPLKNEGARTVYCLPLATSPHMWHTKKESNWNWLSPRPLFAGRSAFPEQAAFFAAARVPRDMLATMRKRSLDGADSPANASHFHRWMEKLNLSPWPGQAIRRAGLGADICSRARRARWISAALPAGLRLIGDEGWRVILPEANIEPPVDYYTALPTRYFRTVILNVTSLLLPHSLSQRHFDVWAAGGALLSDATPGLEIFPPELTRPIILEKPEDFASRMAEMRADPKTGQLCEQWRDLLRREHGYEHRVARICEYLGI
jgi:hypothetical protein